MTKTQRVNDDSIKVVLAQEEVVSKTLVEELHVKSQPVSKWATNTSQPSIQFLSRIPGCVNVDVRTLIKPHDLKGKRPDLPVMPACQRKNSNWFYIWHSNPVLIETSFTYHP